MLARHLLEILAGQNLVYFPLQYFVHYPLAYVAPLLALVLVLHLFSGVEVVRVTRLMLYAWALTLLPPLVDLAAGRSGEGIGYLRLENATLGEVFLRFFDPRSSFGGTTVGIRVEAAVACLLGALYVGLRCRSTSPFRRAWRVLGAAAGIYVTALGFFTLPHLFELLAGLALPAGTSLYAHPAYLSLGEPAGDFIADRICVLYLVPLCLLLAVVWLARATSWRAVGGLALRLPAAEAAAAAALTAGGLGLGAVLAQRLAGAPLIPAPLDVLAAAGLVLAAALVPVSVRLLERPPQAAPPGHAASPLAGWATAAASLFLALGSGGTAPTLLATAGGLLWARRHGPLQLPRWPPAGEVACGLAAVAMLAAGSAWGVQEWALSLLAPRLVWGMLLAGMLAALAARWAGDASRRLAGVACGVGAALALPVAGGAQVAVVAACGGAALAALLPRLAGRRLATLEGTALPAVLALGLFGVLGPEPQRAALAREVLQRPKFMIGQAMELEAQGRHAEAAARYRRVLEIDPARAPVLARLAEILWLRLDDPDAARPLYAASLEADPDQLAARQQFASLLLQDGAAAAALEILEPAVERWSDHPLLLRTWGAALDRIPGREPEAAQAWRRYLEASAGDPAQEADRSLARRRLRALEQEGRNRVTVDPGGPAGTADQ